MSRRVADLTPEQAQHQRERGSAYQRMYRRTEAGRRHTRQMNLAAQHGITPGEFNQLKLLQGGQCAICGTENSGLNSHGFPMELAIDHDHETGKIRGLLCNTCNRFIGLAQDSALLLRQAADYLEEVMP